MAAEAQIYEFLAQALLYPEATFAAKMQARGQALSVLPPWADQMIDDLTGASLEDLQVEHVRLFVNAHGGAPCLPYQSVYAKGMMLGEAAQDVATLYAQWGVEETGEMPDHAAVELAFAAHLARLRQVLPTPDARDFAGQTLEAFEQDHLRAWLPGLSADLQKNADLVFYQALGVALQAVFGDKEAPDRTRGKTVPHQLFQDIPT